MLMIKTDKIQSFSRVPLSRLFYFSQLQRIKQHTTRFESFVDQCLSKRCSVNEKCCVAHGAVNERDFGRLEFLHTIYELLFFNLDIFETELIGCLRQLAQSPIPLESLNDDATVDAFVAECARLNPGIAVSFPETLTQSQSFSGAVATAGTLVSVDCAAFNRRPSAGGHCFDSSRQNAKSANHDASRVYRFGLGSRPCVGQRVGVSIMRALVRQLSEYRCNIVGDLLSFQSRH
jgi:hypothetical protein